MITINLLPVREERRRAGVQQLLLMMGAAFVASIVVCALAHLSITSDVRASQGATAQAQAQIDKFAPQLRQVEEYRKIKADIERKLNVIDDLSDQRSGPVRVFDELATHIPDRVWISRITIESRELRLQGMSLDNELVAVFLTGLEASPYFKNVELVGTEANEKDGFKLNAFEVSANLTSPTAERRAQEEAAAAQSGAPGAGARGLARATGKL